MTYGDAIEIVNQAVSQVISEFSGRPEKDEERDELLIAWEIVKGLAEDHGDIP